MSSSYEDICKEYDGKFDFYKNKKHDRVWWLDMVGWFGLHFFSFDQKEVFELFEDYPHNLTPEQKEIFDKENPYWKKFFKHRQ